MAGEDGDRKAILKLERRPFAEKQDELERMIREDLQDLQLELEVRLQPAYDDDDMDASVGLKEISC